MSFAGQMLLTAASAVALDKARSLVWRGLAAAAALVGLYLVAVTHSATGVLTALLAMTILSWLMVYQATPAGVRAWHLIALAAIVVVLLTAAPELGTLADGFRQNVLHKDATLTGRVYLWSVADHVISQRPVLGHGYKAFFSSGSADAVGFMRSMGATDARGVGFQDTYREVIVDLGFVGLAAFVLTTLPAMLRIIGHEVSRPSPTFAFLTATAVVFMVRSATDMSVEPMYIYTTLIYALAVYGLKCGREVPDGEADSAEVALAAPGGSGAAFRRR